MNTRLTIMPDGEIRVRFFQEIRPKGSMIAITSKTTGHAIVKEQTPSGTARWEREVRQELTEQWGDRPLIACPIAMIAWFYFERPRKPKYQYPVSNGDLEKLIRRINDLLAGNRNKPGPVLVNDALLVRWDQGGKLYATAEHPPGADVRIKVL